MTLKGDNANLASDDTDTVSEEMESNTEVEDGAVEETLDQSEETEQSEGESEDQDQSQEEESNPEQSSGFKFKNKENGNYDWNKINAKLGGSDLERTFKETQGQITRVSQENKQLKQYKSEAEPQMQMFQRLDHLYKSDPGVHAAINKALGIQSQSGPKEDVLPEGVNPKDPLVPYVRKLEQTVNQLLNHQREQVGKTQEQARQDTFRQGLVQAKGAFTQLIGRNPTEDELRRVAEKMQETGYLNGADFVPALFVKEIQQGASRITKQVQNDKRNLPKTVKSTVSPTVTPEKKSKLESFLEICREQGFDDD